jgi:ankyrin repeat protein
LVRRIRLSAFWAGCLRRLPGSQQAMDPLSISVAILAILEICGKTTKYLRSVKESSKESAKIRAELRATEGILNSFLEIIEDAEATGEDWSATIRAVNAAGGPIEQLTDAMSALMKVAEKISHGGLKGFSKSLLWPLKSEEVQDLLKTIDRQKALLVLAIQNDHLQLSKEVHRDTSAIRRDMVVVKETVHRLAAVQDDQERQAIIDWIAAVDYAPRFSDFIGRRQEGTGNWLLDSKEFEVWIDGSGQKMFCPGMPGAGKTMITTIVLQHLFDTYQMDPTVGVAYVYCDARRQHEQKPVDLLLSLLKQVVQEQDAIPDAVENMYIRHKRKRTRPTFDETLSVLQIVAEDFERFYIVVDALDECQVSDSDRSRFLTAVFKLQEHVEGNLFATSRFIPSIQSFFEDAVSVEIRASSEDVVKYIDGHMAELPAFVSRNKGLQAEIKETIVKAVDGMFLLARLHVSSLAGKRSPKALKAALGNLPTGSSGYDHAYDDAMARIRGQNPDSYDLAQQVLSWIICAERPLSPSELQHALAIELDEIELDEENLPELEDIVSVCMGLINVETTSNTIRLVHYTAQEYFDRTWRTHFPDGPERIALACATYLLFDAFQTGHCHTDEEYESRLHENTLFDYSARYWGYHARVANSDEEEVIMRLLKNENNLSATSQVLLASTSYAGYSQKVPRQTRGTHIAAHFGLAKAMKTLLEHGEALNEPDSFGQTPLWWAARSGHAEVVELLLAEPGILVNARDTEHGQTPLFVAVSHGNDEVARLLLERDDVDVNAADTEYGRSPLSFAARAGGDVAIGLLVRRPSIKINAGDTLYNASPLSWAARNGHEKVVAELLKHPDIDVEYKDSEYEMTPFSWAARNGHVEVLKQFLARKDVNINAGDKYNTTPVAWAARDGQPQALKLLLALDGVDLHRVDDYEQTALSWATGCWHDEMARLLMEKIAANEGRRLSTIPRPENMALSIAARNGDLGTVKLELDKPDLDINEKDEFGWNPLLWAIKNDHEAVVRMLLAKDSIDVNVSDTFSQTALHWAAKKGNAGIVRLLLARGDINPNASVAHPYDKGETALGRAARDGHAAVVRLLLDRDDIEVNSTDLWSRKPVAWAAREGHDAVLKMLLARKDVDVNAGDKFGRSGLSWAAREGKESAVRILLMDPRVDVDHTDSYGRKPLSWAEENGHADIARILRLRTTTEPVVVPPVGERKQSGRMIVLLGEKLAFTEAETISA